MPPWNQRIVPAVDLLLGCRHTPTGTSDEFAPAEKRMGPLIGFLFTNKVSLGGAAKQDVAIKKLKMNNE
jgi:hypothetical protein